MGKVKYICFNTYSNQPKVYTKRVKNRVYEFKHIKKFSSNQKKAGKGKQSDEKQRTNRK